MNRDKFAAISFPSSQSLAHIRSQFPKGSRVSLVYMNDVQAPPAGTLGTVVCVDFMGTVHVDWDNGSKLGVVDGVDVIKKAPAAI